MAPGNGQLARADKAKPNRRRPQSSSASRLAAGALGFLKLSQSGDRCVKTVTPRQGLISCQAVLRRRVASLSRQTPFRSLPQQLRPVPLRLRQPLCEPKRWRLLYQPSYAQGAHDPRFSLRIETGDPNVPSCWHLNNYTRLALPGAAPQLSSSTHLTTALHPTRQGR
jgi:hypothetical protein